MHAQEPKQPLYEMWAILSLGSTQTRKSPAGRRRHRTPIHKSECATSDL